MTDLDGLAATDVTLGDVGGVQQVVGTIDGIDVVWRFDDGSELDRRTFIDPDRFAEATPVVARPVVVTVDLDDGQGSGVDLRTVRAELVGAEPVTFFDGARPPGLLPAFPERLRILVGGVPLPRVDAALLRDAAFRRVQLVWEPSVPRLAPVVNVVRVERAGDRVRNEQAGETTFGFDFP